MRRQCAWAIAAVLCGAPACGIDGSKSGDRELCTAVGDPAVECEPVALGGAEDACWRLVQCSAIPVANPESQPSCCFDWAACVEHIEHLPDQQFESALACIESSSCDDLKPRAGRAHGADLPACLEQL
ncbi:MAG TPA: hypothetical protein VNO33_12580 [Kofleriaceae bacterium]|nr:hypothetical protein [Kofleriaceae bacterium]